MPFHRELDGPDGAKLTVDVEQREDGWYIVAKLRLTDQRLAKGPFDEEAHAETEAIAVVVALRTALNAGLLERLMEEVPEEG